jgi:hypothetical protein
MKMDKPEILSIRQLVFVILTALIAGLSCYPPVSLSFIQRETSSLFPLLGLALASGGLGFQLARGMKYPSLVAILCACFVSSWASAINAPFFLSLLGKVDPYLPVEFIVGFVFLLLGFILALLFKRKSSVKYLVTYIVALCILALGHYITFVQINQSLRAG